MVRWRRTTACERAAQWISLDLDGELGVLERAGLARHLQRCERCRALSSDIGGFTRLLREAPEVEPERPVAPVVVRRQPKRVRHVTAVAFAAVSIAAGVAALSAPPGRQAGSALGFQSQQQQHRFAKEHVGTEPQAPVDNSAPPPPLSLGLRALR